MRIVSRYPAMIGKGFVFEDGPREKLRKASYQKPGQPDRFEFDGSNSYIGIESMRVVDDKTTANLDTIDAELADLNQRARDLRRTRQELLAKGYNKFRKVYKWDLEETL